ncbi:ABC transporter ATP-binding protein [Paenibacillus solani]|uniref:ABC transporter ATP-binding protein n=1 Tax=Paenibacillus solani TaxID=1705565 RepID=UPI003D2A6080
MLRLENVSHSFKNGNEVLKVLHHIEFEVQKGEMIALLGSSGSGKSTLLNLMAGLMKPTEGRIYIADQDIVKYGENKLAVFRRKHIGFIFQAYELIPTLTVLENVELPLVFQSVSASKRRHKAMELLEMTGIGDKASLYPSQLSGGQQQRVSIARSLITEPSVIFADEPTGNLDTKTEEEIIRILMELNESMKTTFVIVTHELEVAARMKKTIMLRDGYLVQPESEKATVSAADGRREATPLQLTGETLRSEGAGEVS